MDKFWKILIPVICIILLIILGACIYCFWPAIQGLITGNKYYTADDIQNSYNKGLEDGNKSKSELEEQVKNYKALINDLNNQIEVLNTQLSELDGYKDIALTHEKTIKELQKTIEYYEQNIENILGDRCSVTFYVDGSVYDVQIVEKDSTITAPTISQTQKIPFGLDNEKYINFNGWSIDGENIVDVGNYNITSNTTFTALLDISFKYDLTAVNKSIAEANKAVAKANDDKNNAEKQILDMEKDSSFLVTVQSELQEINIFDATVEESYNFLVENSNDLDYAWSADGIGMSSLILCSVEDLSLKMIELASKYSLTYNEKLYYEDDFGGLFFDCKILLYIYEYQQHYLYLTQLIDDVYFDNIIQEQQNILEQKELEKEYIMECMS